MQARYFFSVVAGALLAGTLHAEECDGGTSMALPDCVTTNITNNGTDADATNHCANRVKVKVDRQDGESWTWTLDGDGGSDYNGGSKVITGFRCCDGVQGSDCNQSKLASATAQCKDEYFAVGKAQESCWNEDIEASSLEPTVCAVTATCEPNSETSSATVRLEEMNMLRNCTGTLIVAEGCE